MPCAKMINLLTKLQQLKAFIKINYFMTNENSTAGCQIFLQSVNIKRSIPR